jgi:hypothetical protein
MPPKKPTLLQWPPRRANIIIATVIATLPPSRHNCHRCLIAVAVTAAEPSPTPNPVAAALLPLVHRRCVVTVATMSLQLLVR